VSISASRVRVIAAERGDTRGEQLANTLSSLLGLLVVLGLSPLLVHAAQRSANPYSLAGAIVFSFALIALYLASTLYHGLPPGRAKHLVRLFDHAAIFLLIAGTYTPFALGPLRDHGGWWLLLCEWTLAVLGVVFKIAGGIRHRRLSNLIYLGMGWLGLFWMRPFLQHVPLQGFAWLLAGGIAYTAGIAFYAAKHRHYAHFVWHLFVFVGTCCHAYAVLEYAF
jgi:hemolysin III